MLRRVALILLILTLPISQAQAETMFGSSKEKRFWKWFEKNEDRLFHFEDDQELVFSKLGERLSAVHQDLVFEFGPLLDNGKRDFVVSADGLQRAFPAVESLVGAAPRLERWNWIEFRQRGKPHVEISYRGVSVDFAKTSCELISLGDHVDFVIYYEEYDSDQSDIYEELGYLIVDHLLGEFDTVAKVAEVRSAPASEADPSWNRPLEDLPARFDTWASEQRESYH